MSLQIDNKHTMGFLLYWLRFWPHLVTEIWLPRCASVNIYSPCCWWSVSWAVPLWHSSTLHTLSGYRKIDLLWWRVLPYIDWMLTSEKYYWGHMKQTYSLHSFPALHEWSSPVCRAPTFTPPNMTSNVGPWRTSANPVHTCRVAQTRQFTGKLKDQSIALNPIWKWLWWSSQSIESAFAVSILSKNSPEDHNAKL